MMKLFQSIQKTFMKHKILAALLIVFVVLFFLCLVMKGNLIATQKTKENGVREEGFKNMPIFTMYHMNWCGYCKMAKPEFDKLMTDPIQEKVQIRSVEGEESKENAEECSQKNISGYPTFILTKDGEDTKYQGERTKEGFISFLKQHC